jgi:hypothetical protein
VTPDIVTVNQAGSGTSALPEPTNFPSQFSAYTIHIQWTDAIGTFVPEGYLIRMSSIGFEDISNPVDGVPVTDGPNSKNIPAGIQQAWFGNLNPATHYYFKIYGYSGSWNSINYKTDGTIPQVEATTEP